MGQALCLVSPPSSSWRESDGGDIHIRYLQLIGEVVPKEEAEGIRDGLGEAPQLELNKYTKQRHASGKALLRCLS